MKKDWDDFKKWVCKPWRMKYRIVEVTEWNNICSRMDTCYQIHVTFKYFPLFWWNESNRDYSEFCSAYSKMTKLRGVPKTRKQKLNEADCVLRLMGEEEE